MAALSCLPACLPDGGMPASTDGVTARTSALAGDAEKFWDSPSIPVCWDLDGWDTEKAWVADQIKRTWETETGITFTGWGHCQDVQVPTALGYGGTGYTYQKPPGIHVVEMDVRPKKPRPSDRISTGGSRTRRPPSTRTPIWGGSS
jgi:hypothetical protein